MTEWRKILAGTLTASICLFGLTATVDASGSNKGPGKPPKRAEWDRKPTDHPKLDRKLNGRAERGGAGTSRVIVRLQPGAELGGEYLAYAAKRGRKLNIIGGEVVEVPNFMLRRLADNKKVLSISHDRPTGGEMNRAAVVTGARAVQQLMGYQGAGVGVAVIDSGITAWHDDLTYLGSNPKVKVVAGQRTLKFVDFVNGRTTPYDDHGHGTHVAGIILGNGYDTFGARAGIAPAANLVSLKVLDNRGGGYISSVIAALEWSIVNKAAYNIRVINLSVGAAVTESYTTDPLCLAAKRAVDAGIVVVTAAGNLGKNRLSGLTQYGGITAPGNAPWVLTVGAYSTEGTITRTDDKIGGYSSRGPTARDFMAKPDVVAPGTGIVSLSVPGSTLYNAKQLYLLKGTLPLLGTSKPYLSLTGTSMAAPIVAGTVALMLEANPKLTPNLVKAIIEYTAQTYNYDVLTQGAGFLNTKGAVDLAKYLKSPTVGSRYPSNRGWSRQIIWGNRRLAKGVIKPTGSAWALNTVWGAAADGEGDNIVWGTVCGSDLCDNIVWGTATDLDGDNIVWGTVDRQGDNIVWGTADGESDNIVWGTACGDRECDNIVWGTECGGADCDNIVWGASVAEGELDNIVWGTAEMDASNIVWGTAGEVDNIVWGTSSEEDNVTWGCSGEETPVFDDPDSPTVFANIDFEALFADTPEPLPVSNSLTSPPLSTEPQPLTTAPLPTAPLTTVGGGF
ncbi:MAG: S8 family peptidase [Vicinamibacterales bacterium]